MRIEGEGWGEGKQNRLNIVLISLTRVFGYEQRNKKYSSCANNSAIERREGERRKGGREAEI